MLWANPLEEIGNSREIEAVILDSRVWDRGALDALLADVERAVAAVGS